MLTFTLGFAAGASFGAVAYLITRASPAGRWSLHPAQLGGLVVTSDEPVSFVRIIGPSKAGIEVN